MSRGFQDQSFRSQVVETAKKLDYFANTGAFGTWVRLAIHTDSQAEILVSFHATGYEFRGIVGASACFFRRVGTGDQERQIIDLRPLTHDLFQVNYLESSQEVEARFQDWLEDVLVAGLETWRAGL